MRTNYDLAFYEGQADGSARSAKRIVDVFLAAFPCKSVVDIGCGVGTWLAAFQARGVEDVTGIDGAYVDKTMLRIPPERFVAADLRAPLTIERRYDVACSLEVAEHLPLAAAESFVADLVRCAPVVLFSAAIPRQGGMSHVNERWQSYWADLFAARGYVALDFIRPQVFEDPAVEWWYQQNVLVFCEPSRVPAGMQPVTSRYELDRVHPQVVENLAAAPHSGSEAIVALQRSALILSRVSGRRLRRMLQA